MSLPMPRVVSAEWLADNLAWPDLALFDCTKYPPGHPLDGRLEFGKAHILRALYLDIDEIADPEAGPPRMVPRPGRFARLLGDLGVSNRARVVFYDQGGMASAARGWWLMRLFGHEAAAVLDGGLPKWLAAGGPTEAGMPLPPAPVLFVPDLQPKRLKLLEDMKRILAWGEALVLDARSSCRFDGILPEARNLACAELLKPDGTLMEPASLREIFARAGVDGSQPVVSTSGTGVSACLIALAMAHAGLPEGAVYDGSWAEWASRPKTPKAASRGQSGTTAADS